MSTTNKFGKEYNHEWYLKNKEEHRKMCLERYYQKKAEKLASGEYVPKPRGRPRKTTPVVEEDQVSKKRGRPKKTPPKLEITPAEICT